MCTVSRSVPSTQTVFTFLLSAIFLHFSPPVPPPSSHKLQFSLYLLQVDTAPIDPRFTATNQSRHCFVKYNEAHKCFAEAGEDAPQCARLARDYRSLCPAEWVAAWNEARENGAWWGKY